MKDQHKEAPLRDTLVSSTGLRRCGCVKGLGWPKYRFGILFSGMGWREYLRCEHDMHPEKLRAVATAGTSLVAESNQRITSQLTRPDKK